MNKNIVYIAIAMIVGLVAGYFIFGGTDSNIPDTKITEQHMHHESEGNEQWTCAMHPQIMQPEPGSCPICAMDLIPVAINSEGHSMNGITLTENAMALANVQTSIVGTQLKGEKSFTLSGKMAMNTEKNAVQVSYFDGRIERLFVNYEGQEVRKGQLLAQIYAPELVAAQQELITAASLKTAQPALYKAVQNKLKLWKLSEKQIKTIEQSGKIQEYVPIYATVAGTVGAVMIKEGDHVKRGQALLELNDLSSIWATFDVYENQLPQLKLGAVIQMTTRAYSNETFKGEISFIDPILNVKTRTVMVRATVHNKDKRFKPGMFVSGVLKEKSDTESSRIAVPASAVLWTGKRSLVYVKENSQAPIFEMREVMLGAHIGDGYLILSGLENGEEIVTNGTFTIDAAAQLQGKKSMMNHQNDMKKEKMKQEHDTMSEEKHSMQH